MARELIAAEPERAGQLPGAGQAVRGPRAATTRPRRRSRRPSTCGRTTGWATSCWPASTTARASSTRRWRRSSSAPTAEPNNPEAWHTIGGFYQDKVFRDKKLAQAKVALDYTLKGIEAEDKALALNPEYFEALTFKNILLRQQALYEKDPAEAEGAASSEADDSDEKALEVQKKQNQGAAAAAAAATAGKKGASRRARRRQVARPAKAGPLRTLCSARSHLPLVRSRRISFRHDPDRVHAGALSRRR